MIVDVHVFHVLTS